MMNRTVLLTNNLVSLTKVLLRRVDVQEILAGRLAYDDISYQTAAAYMCKDEEQYLNYSHLECLQMVESIADYICDQDAHGLRIARYGRLNVFTLLLETNELLLTDTEPVTCQYNQLLSWRKLAKGIGEEIPVSAMYAFLDARHGSGPRNKFDWEYVLHHNNYQLNAVVERGISDHHFHLFASIPYFQVSWINLMNSVCNDQFERSLCRIERQSRVPFPRQYIDDLLNSSGEQKNEVFPLIVHHLQAALIRFYLCTRLCGYSAENESCRNNFISLEYVRYLLQSPEQLILAISDLQSAFSQFGLNDYPDYALSLFPFSITESHETQYVLYGERWFLYSMFRDIYAKMETRCLSPEEHNLFYAYLCLQNELRFYMVQVNNHVGFDNFQQYQGRHGYFFTSGRETGILSTKLAVQEPLLKTPYLLEIEARISPHNTAEGDYDFISQLDEAICDSLQEPELVGLDGNGFDLDAFKKRFYYVFHFIKRRDIRRAERPQGILATEFERRECRHAELRRRLEIQARALLRFRAEYPNTASRVKGIDAASQEIGCRPEVFAPVFRLLGNSALEGNWVASPTLKRLRKTYHAGEDFLDVIDGLRAIDEAIHFLNLDCGDRIGHAIVLGIDPEAWYKGKAYQVSLYAHDYLDNLAWMYHAMERIGTEEFQPLKDYIVKQFDIYFREIYLVNMDEEELAGIMQRAERAYEEASDTRGYHAHRCNFNIEIYYKAWTLRGDDPKLYRDGFYQKGQFTPDCFEVEDVNQRFPPTFEDRYIPEGSLLYYNYHFNPQIKDAGWRKITVPIRKDYARACSVIQKWMRTQVAQYGLAIETNPSSNALISTFREYAQHPLYRFYNKYLASSAEQEACMQLNVSINTDDNGVFFTSLENEYALMARAAELICDEDEKPKYKKSDIYEWLDHIRQMGNDQSFQR